MGGGEQGIKLLCGTWREALNGNSQERRASEGEALRRAVQPQAARVAGQFESAIDETQETLQEESLLWADQVMSDEAVHDIIHNMVDLLLGSRNFVAVAPLTWVRSLDAPIRQMFCYKHRGDASLAPCWAVSLDFAPHISDEHVLGWHASAAQAMPDITAYPPHNHLDLFHRNGPGPIKRDMMQVILPAVQTADRFWNVCAMPAGPHRALQWAMAYMKPMGQQWLDSQNPLAMLFVAAKFNGLDSALALLDHWFTSEPHPPQTKAWIRELLVEAAKAPFPPAPESLQRPGLFERLTTRFRRPTPPLPFGVRRP